MNFSSALQGLRFGHKVRVNSWPEGNYLFMKDGNLECYIQGYGERPILEMFTKDILSEQWELA